MASASRSRWQWRRHGKQGGHCACACAHRSGGRSDGVREVQEASVGERADVELEGAEGGELGQALKEAVSDLRRKGVTGET